MKEIAWTLALIISTVLLALHCGSILVSVTSKELKKFRFLTLTLYLSFSDSVLGVEFIYVTVLNFSQLNGPAYLYQCMLIKHIIAGTLTFSLFQTLILCVERFRATFVVQKCAVNKLTNGRMIALGFVVLHVISICPFLIGLRNDPEPCDVQYTLSPSFIATDVLFVSFLSGTVVLYTVIMIRIYKAGKVLRSPNSGGITNQNTIENGTCNPLNIRRHILTLGVIIVVASISLLPRIILSFYVYATGDLSKSVRGFMWFANNVLLMLCPLLDPVIYVLRLKKYREILKKKCCSWRSSTVGPS